ncbi:MAG: hypothetical protein H6805_09885 [Planctomycetes bacterium]|nr:hypothetical protein [Planctomycetota bacterium]
MHRIVMGLGALALVVGVSAAPALADGSARDVQAALDSYLAHDTADVALVGGPGSAGYDNGFWIRGGDFLLRANVTLQARFEAFDHDETQPPETSGGGGILMTAQQALPTDFGGDLSGFSLPRATLKLSGEAPCNIRWYMELEFGHFGRDALSRLAARCAARTSADQFTQFNLGPFFKQQLRQHARAWDRSGAAATRCFRMGQIALPTTHQLWSSPSCSSSSTSRWPRPSRAAPAWLHGSQPRYGHDPTVRSAATAGGHPCWQSPTVTAATASTTSPTTAPRDGLAFSSHLNWAFAKPIGYQENALARRPAVCTARSVREGFTYADRTDKAAHGLGTTGLSTASTWPWAGGLLVHRRLHDGRRDGPLPCELVSVDLRCLAGQLGCHFPGTAWGALTCRQQLRHHLTTAAVVPGLRSWPRDQLLPQQPRQRRFSVDISSSFFEGNDPARYDLGRHTGIGGYARRRDLRDAAPLPVAAPLCE